MITKKLKIKNEINVTEYCENYSYMFRKLYSNFELSVDANFQKELREKYKLDSWFFQSCLVDVKMKLNQNETNRENKLNKTSELEGILEKDKFVGLKGRTSKFKINKKLNYLKNHIDKEITFGTLELLRRISYLPNYLKQLNAKLENEKNPIELNKIKLEVEKTQNELIELKLQYKKNRILAIVSVGEAPQKSNRKFDFDFINKKLVFKPEHGIKMPIEFYCGKSEHEELKKLQEQIGEQAITIKLDNDYVYISYDEEKLNNFHFNKNEYFKEVKNIPKENKEARKECYKYWINEQESRKFSGKNINRFISFDLNPEYIGFCVLEHIGNGEFKILHKEVISLTSLNTKMGLSSTDILQIKQNNKRIHEINEVWKYIFKIASHYKVSNVVIEDLDFKEKGVNENAKEANRKTKNLWYRTLTTNSIQKYCNVIGLKLIKVNACYSSFIGNIKHNYYDPLNASIEVGRRGITKYLKGMFYSPLERTDLDTMYQFGLDVQGKTISTWVEAFNLFKTAKLRYRRELQNFVENNLLSHKSCVISYKF